MLFLLMIMDFCIYGTYTDTSMYVIFQDLFFSFGSLKFHVGKITQIPKKFAKSGIFSHTKIAFPKVEWLIEKQILC